MRGLSFLPRLCTCVTNTVDTQQYIRKAGVCIAFVSVTECIVCVSGYDPLTFSFLFFAFFDGGGGGGGDFMAPII